MAEIFELEQIKAALEEIDAIQYIEEGFLAYSRGEVVVPPIGEMIFDKFRGISHIKYGFIDGDDYFVIKAAAAFHDNVKMGLPTISGLMLLFSQRTGALLAVLLDEGHLTGVRTAAAGAVVAKYMAPGIVWGVSQEEVEAYSDEMEALGYRVETTLDAARVAASCNFIVTVTPSRKPLIHMGDLLPGTHITAVGSDTPEKQELDPQILARADIVVADSIEQCRTRGEIFQAARAGVLDEDKPVELGNVIKHSELRRLSDDQLTVADLTGVAVQDLQISKAVYEKLSPGA